MSPEQHAGWAASHAVPTPVHPVPEAPPFGLPADPAAPPFALPPPAADLPAVPATAPVPDEPAREVLAPPIAVVEPPELD